jgi:hypothetical protein
MVDGTLWDRVEERAPRFDVREWHREKLRCFQVVAGQGCAFEPRARINVCRDRLQALGLATGPWLQELKREYLAGNHTHVIVLPDGSRASVEQLKELGGMCGNTVIPSRSRARRTRSGA